MMTTTAPARLMVRLDHMPWKERCEFVLAGFSDDFLEYQHRALGSARMSGAHIRRSYLGVDSDIYGGSVALEEEVYPLFRCLGAEGRRILKKPARAHAFRDLRLAVTSLKRGSGNPVLLPIACQYVASHTIKRAIMRYFFETRTVQKTLRVMARKDGQKDLLCKVRVGPHHHFATAFACAERMRAGTLDEWGRFLIRVNKVGTTQDAVRVYCLCSQTTRTNGRTLVYDYLQRHSQTAETYQEAWSALYTIAEMWPEDVRVTESSIQRDLVGVLENYLEETLLKKKRSSGWWWAQGSGTEYTYTACRSRLSAFCKRNPVMAQVLWESYNPTGEEGGNVFATPRNRERFAATLELSKFSAVFKMANSVRELTDQLEKRGIIHGSSVRDTDSLPGALRQNLDKAQQAYREAVGGIPIGCWGARYYDSEAMDLALTQLDRAKAAARAWCQKQQNQKAKKAVKLGVA